MAEQKKVDQPTAEAKESLESVIQRLTEENVNIRKVAEQAMKENGILKATVKALSQLI